MAIRFQSTYINTYKNVFRLLPKTFKKKFFGVQALIIVTSFVDLFGLALFIPILSAVADESVLTGDGKLAQLKTWSGVENSNDFLLYLFIVAFCFFILRSLFILFSQWIQNKFVYRVYRYIGSSTYEHYLNMPYEDFMKHDSPQVVRELTVSPQHFSTFLIKSLLLINSELIVLLLVVGGIAIYDFKVFLLILCTIFPVAFLFNLLVKKRMKAYGETQNKLTPELYRNSNRGIFGFIDVKLRQKESTLLSDYTKTLVQLNNISLRTSVLGVVPAKLFELVTVGGLLVIFWYGAFIASNPEIVLPLIALYAAAGYRVIPSLSKIIPSFLHLQQYAYLFDIYKKPLTEKVEKFASKSSEASLNFNEKIDLNNITFSFNDTSNPFFKDLNLSINKGEIVGIIGRSGSGKTTLVKMLAGFIQYQKGEIKIDDVTLSPTNFPNWRRKISYVQQSPYVENTSLAKNIAFLEDDIDAERLNNAIEKASLTELVGNTSPFDFQIKENGKNLSGGQKQRILIARALYHDADLIILDEATSALDNETENEINTTVSKLKNSGTTVIIIAHRYTTLQHTNRIVQMEHGKIIKMTDYNAVNASQNITQ
ncbi:ABC transporter ATP-binding protein [Crocinitomix algicola]|uniref:ABC transporter ATP-binding protein n=1 Tax=Crocinitomix algicola TaxID=1740263 RepID=UPI0008308B2B|nr:ABC transporter ATP-binding protein [Crocinitomix algicola]